MIKLDAIKNFSRLHPDKISLSGENNSISWKEFEKQTTMIINFIANHGDLKNEEKILFISRNSIDVILMAAAFSTLGIPFQGIDYHMEENAIKLIINQLEVKHVFISDEFSIKFLSLNEICQINCISDFISSAQSNESNWIQVSSLPARPFTSYSITSGTSGHPKIVYRSTSFDGRRFDYLQKRYLFDNSDIHLACLPIYHASTSGWLRLFLGLGCTVIIHNLQDIYQLCELLHSKQVSTTIMSPVMLKQIADILDDKIPEKYFNKLRFLITGGKNCPANIKNEAIRKLGAIIYEYYGTTESGINTLIDPDEALLHPGSVGRVFEGNEIVILDGTNSVVENGGIGKIAICSYMNMDGYLNHLSNFVFIQNKKYWVTSDFGYMDSEGYLYVMQRENSSQANVYNYFAIENEILKLSYISDAGVLGFRNDSLLINVVPKKYCPYLEVKTTINKILENFGVSKSLINVVPKLDYTLTGKVKLLSIAA